jgi:hypothetical protein
MSLCVCLGWNYFVYVVVSSNCSTARGLIHISQPTTRRQEDPSKELRGELCLQASQTQDYEDQVEYFRVHAIYSSRPTVGSVWSVLLSFVTVRMLHEDEVVRYIYDVEPSLYHDSCQYKGS